LNSFYASTFGGHLPPFFRGHFNRFFHLIAAKENYEIAMERYLLGDLPGIEMREAQKSLLDAEERILTAQYNTKLCEISLQQISGNVMVYLE